MHTSGAVMMQDLARQWIKEGHHVSVVTPITGRGHSIDLQNQSGCDVFYVPVLATKDVHHVLRALAEWLNPYLIWFLLRCFRPFTQQAFDGVVWYSPSIFWAPFIKRAKHFFRCPSYLILRDIFPDWALDLGILKHGLQYRFLKWVQGSQYQQADAIGVQSPNNLISFNAQNPQLKNRTHVLWNWGSLKVDQRDPADISPKSQATSQLQTTCSIDLSKTSLAGRTLFVYAGNMGLAQGIDVLVDLAGALTQRSDLGFVLVGRGSEVDRLRARIANEHLSNIQIFDEIAADQIEGLYAQCHAGILSLDLRHSTHNIPGKFVSYMQAGIPVLAIVNEGNDLLELIQSKQLGVACSTHLIPELIGSINGLLELSKTPAEIRQRCHAFFTQYLSVHSAAKQIEYQLHQVKTGQSSSW